MPLTIEIATQWLPHLLYLCRILLDGLTFCKAFPYHVVFDSALRIKHAGLKVFISFTLHLPSPTFIKACQCGKKKHVADILIYWGVYLSIHIFITDCLSITLYIWIIYIKVLIRFHRYRPYAYDVTEGRPAALGVKRGTATCAIAKHAASGPTPACHTRRAGPGPRTDWEAERQCALPAQHMRAAWPPTWRRCYGVVTSMQNYWTHAWFCTAITAQALDSQSVVRNFKLYLYPLWRLIRNDALGYLSSLQACSYVNFQETHHLKPDTDPNWSILLPASVYTQNTVFTRVRYSQCSLE